MEATLEKIALERYAEYKDSGVEWLGEIPEHWEVTRLGVVLNPLSSKNRTDLPLLSITRERGVILRDLENEEENHNFIPDDLSNYKMILKGQFGMNKMKAWQGSYGISGYDGIVSPAYYIFNLSDRILPEYFHFAIRSKLYVSFFGSASDGVRIGQWDLSKSRMKQIPFLIPSRNEQIQIANLLNDKLSKADEAIAIKQKQIQLLKERRQILIHNAVTRGLDKNVKMKDSGVEWIGEIPEGWSVPKMKHICKFILDGTHGSFPRVDDGYRLLSVRNIVGHSFMFRDDDSMVSKKHFKEISSKFLIQNGDIQLAIVGATMGKVAMVENLNEKIVTQRSLCTIRLNEAKCVNKFLFYYLQSSLFQSFLWTNTGFSAQPGIYLGAIQNCHLAIPSLNEQMDLIKYLNTINNKFHRATNLKEKEIEKLKEYKGSLINSVVTGKVKVF